MEIWYNVIVFSKETLVHYYHKYVKAGVSPPFQIQSVRVVTGLLTFWELFGKFPRNCACGYFFSFFPEIS